MTIFQITALTSLLLSFSVCNGFSPLAGVQSPTKARVSTSMLQMATVPPSLDNTVGIVGRGFISVLSAKLAAMQGYNTWLLSPPGQEDVITSLVDNPDLPLELVESTDTDRVETLIGQTDAYIIAVDDQSTMDEAVIKFIMNPETSKAKRISAMSRNLNGKDMGFLVKASKATANNEVWDNSNAAEYKKFEDTVKKQAADLGGDYTIVRAGTLKGGAEGEDPLCTQYLSNKFYEMTKKDIVTWQLLFDCNVRGVKLAKGDVLPGAGGKAVFTATATEACPGDSSRCAVAEALVRSLNSDACTNIDFGVATEDARDPPTSEEWEQMFATLS